MQNLPAGLNSEIEARLSELVVAEDPLAGRKIGNRYEIRALLGRGGMGEVYLAYDHELQRPVALKIIRSLSCEDERRFRREAHQQSKLDHPYIAPVYDVGADGGLLYLAMRYVAGAAIDRTPLSLRERVEAIRDAALAVHEAHRLGIVHRDIKPANILMEGRRVQVIDFGLARPMHGDARITASGVVCGTPAYMSPEQARGQAVDPRSDIYSLGATLYELVTQRLPFEALSSVELLRKIELDDPRPPRAYNPNVGRELDTIILKCLAKEPSRRYAGALDLAEDLDRWLSGRAVLAHPPSVAYQLRKFVSRRRWVLLGAAAFLVVAFCASLWLGGVRQRLGRARQALEDGVRLEGEGRHEEARLAYQVLLALYPKDARAREGLDRTDGRIRLNRGIAKEASGDIDGALEEYEAVLRAFPDHAEALGRRGGLRLAKADLDGAIADLERSLRHAPPNWDLRLEVEARLERAERLRR
ncbi:MAG: protein kinase [Planctomycetes bacterium]|nr:protein kinase [Planctomycetota bacterium]